MCFQFQPSTNTLDLLKSFFPQEAQKFNVFRLDLETRNNVNSPTARSMAKFFYHHMILNPQFSIIRNGQNTVCFYILQLLGSINHLTRLFNHPIWYGPKSVSTAVFRTRDNWLHFSICDSFSSNSIQLIACQNLKTMHIKYNIIDFFSSLDRGIQWNLYFLGQCEWESKREGDERVFAVSISLCVASVLLAICSHVYSCGMSFVVGPMSPSMIKSAAVLPRH